MDKRLFRLLFCLCVALGPQVSLIASTSISTPFTENRGQFDLKSTHSPSSPLFVARSGNALVCLYSKGLTITVESNGRSFSAKLNFLGSSATCPEPHFLASSESHSALYQSPGSSIVANSANTVVYPNLLPNIDLQCSISNAQLCLSYVAQPNANTANLFHFLSSWEGPCIQRSGSNTLSFLMPSGEPLWSAKFSDMATIFLNSSRVTPSAPSPRTYVGAFTTGSNESQNASTLNANSSPKQIQTTIDLSSYLGGNGADSTTCGFSSSNGMVICGGTASSNFPVTSGVQQGSLSGPRDAFVTRFDASGHRLWSTYFGAAGDEIAYSCCIANGKVYIAGRTTSSSGLSTTPALQAAYGGGSADAFIACFDDATGKLQNCSYYGGSDFDEARGVTVLPNGSVAVVGTTMSSDLIMTGQQKQFNGGPSDAFVFVCSPTLQSNTWSSYYGGRSSEEGRAVGAMSDGSVIICGTTSSPNSGGFIAANGSEGSSPPGGLQASGYVARLDATGTRIWGRYLGGDQYDTLSCVTIKNDNIFVGGYSNSSAGSANNFVSGGSSQSGYGGGPSDGFVTRLSADSRRVWGTYIGGSGADRCLGLYVTGGLDVFACGTTSSTDFPTALSDAKSLNGPSDAFLTFILRDGSKAPASLLIGGSGDDYACAVGQQADLSVLVAGATSSSDFKTVDATQNNFGGTLDAWIQRYEALYTVDVHDELSATSTQTPLCFPNPVNTTASVRLPDSWLDDASVSLEIIDQLGRTVLSQTMSTETLLSAHTASLPNGCYTLVLRTAHHAAQTVFVKFAQ